MRKLLTRTFGILTILTASLSTLHAQEEAAEVVPAGVEVSSLSSFPEVIELNSGFEYRQLVITGHVEGGESLDLTRIATLEGKPTHVDITADGYVSSLSEGTEAVTYRYGDLTISIPVKVSGLDKVQQVSFVQDVQPVLSKMGCNAGTCHGAKDGKNGFKLSLRGYDPLYDHRALTDELSARRFNRAAPDQSLMLLKATGSTPHVGGVRTEFQSRYYNIVREWVAKGAKLDLDASRVTSIELFPKNPVLPRADMIQQIAVLATFADGTVRDVSREAFIESGNIEVVETEGSHLLRTLRRGEAAVLVRYEGNYAATTLTVMGDRTGFAWEETETYNYLDQLVYDKLETVRVLPSDVCSDEEFVRRIYLDITGLPPTTQQVLAFLDDETPSRTKREALIDQLVGSPEYIEHFTNKWADLLQVNRKFLGEQGAIAMRNWIKQAIATNTPYDEFAKSVITASGSTLQNPPASYYKILRTPEDLMENTTHLFLAVRFNCNKCHDHPFERWTQDQYYNLAAYFAQIGRKEDPLFTGQRIGGSAVEGAKPLVEVIYDTGAGEVTHNRTGETAPASFPYPHNDVAADGSRREQLAQWITSSENQHFASSYVNRLWGYMFGVGIIEPIDDIRAGNPPTNPRLLSALTEDFVESGFNVQHMLKTICKSRVYQHSVVSNEWNEDDEINYSHAVPRRLPAEVLYDAIHVATGSVQQIPGVPRGFRAAELPDVGIKVPFLDDFGRPVRESACECERSSGMMLGPIMKLINGPTVADALQDPENALNKMVNEIEDDRELIKAIFLRFLSRLPSDAEIEAGLGALENAGNEHEGIAKALSDYEATIPTRVEEYAASLRKETAWQDVEVVDTKTATEATLTLNEDNSITAGGPTKKDTYTVTLNSKSATLRGIRLEVFADDALPAKGPGRAPNGNFVLSEFRVQAAPIADPTKAIEVKLQNPVADINQDGYVITSAVDGNNGTGWAIANGIGKSHTAVFEFENDVTFEGGIQLTIEMIQHHDDSHQIGKFRLAVSDSPRPITLNKLDEALATLVNTPADQRTDEQTAQLRAKYMETDKIYPLLKQQFDLSAKLIENKRLTGVQDLSWALINTPSFLFNR